MASSIRSRWTVRVVALIATMAATTGAASATEQQSTSGRRSPGHLSPRFAPAPCPVPVPDGLVGGVDVTCGTVDVPQFYDRRRSPVISVGVVVRLALDRPSAKDPLLMLGGGPGDNLVALLGLLLSPESPLGVPAPDRDLILVNQRGVGFGALGFGEPRLECPEVVEASVIALTLPSGEATEVVKAAYAACHTRLVDEGYELSGYTTANNARDLDQVRRALGYRKVNVYGTSYGTRLALEAARQRDDGAGWIRTLTLSSTVPLEINFAQDVVRAYDEALRALFDDCAADPVCATAYPDLEGTFTDLVVRLRDEPVVVPVDIPGLPGDPPVTIPIVIDGARLSAMVFALMYQAPQLPALPALITEFAAGDPVMSGVLAAGMMAAARNGGVDADGSQSIGMQRSFVCAEEVGYLNVRRSEREARRLGPVFESSSRTRTRAASSVRRPRRSAPTGTSSWRRPTLSGGCAPRCRPWW